MCMCVCVCAHEYGCCVYEFVSNATSSINRRIVSSLCVRPNVRESDMLFVMRLFATSSFFTLLVVSFNIFFFFNSFFSHSLSRFRKIELATLVPMISLAADVYHYTHN